MVEFREVPAGGLLRDLLGGSTVNGLNALEAEDGLENQPYQKHRTAGFHRVVLPNE